MVTKKRVELAESMVRSRRFAGLNLSSYRSVLDKEVEKQFAAIIFSLPELDYHQPVSYTHLIKTGQKTVNDDNQIQLLIARNVFV